MSAARSESRCSRISTWSSSGSSSSTSARRSSSSAATTSLRRCGVSSWITLAASAGRRSASEATRCSAPWLSWRSWSPSTSSHSTTWVCARRRKPFAPSVSAHPREHPVAGAGLLHRHVEDDALDAAAAHAHLAVEHLADHQGLGGPLLEATHVQQAGRDHLPGVDVGDPRHRREDLAATEHLDDQADHARLPYVGTQHHHDVTHLAHRVALGVEHRQPGQPGREDAGRSGAHVRNPSRR